MSIKYMYDDEENIATTLKLHEDIVKVGIWINHKIEYGSKGSRKNHIGIGYPIKYRIIQLVLSYLVITV